MAVAPDIGDDVGDADHAGLERHGTKRLHIVEIARIATIDDCVELLKSTQAGQLENALLIFAVMAEHSVEGLQREIPAVQPVQDADGMDVVEKRTAGPSLADVVQQRLPRMSEGRMAEVVPETDRLDEIAIEAKCAADVARDTGHELHVQAATGQVIVAAEAEDLRLAVIAVVCGKVQDLLGVAHVGGAPDAVAIGRAVLPADHVLIECTVGIDPSPCTVVLHTLDERTGQLVGHGI